MSRFHLKYASFEVTKWKEGIIGAYPTKTREIRLVNTGQDYRSRPGYNRTTSRCLRVERENSAAKTMPVREQGASILSRVGSAFARTLAT